MKKQKSLTKRIQRLKIRMAKNAKKLAKLTLKLSRVVTAGRAHGKRKPAVRPSTARKRPQASAAPKARKRAAAPRKAAKQTIAVQPKSAVSPKKKKLNLTPERRAQLVAAMKARWDAKRAAAAKTQGASGDQGSAGNGA